jgi:alkylated DNA repair protein alkB family protein 8
MLVDTLKLPYKSNVLDAVLCIAVIHHFTTDERRKQAISEIMRVLNVGGHALIYVWAKEQNKNSIKSYYLKSNIKSKKYECKVNQDTQLFSSEMKIILPIHKNRTEFTYSDMLVPWTRKNGGEFLRYYHVFEEGELENLCSLIPSTKVNNVYYDQGNWCAVLEKF